MESELLDGAQTGSKHHFTCCHELVTNRKNKKKMKWKNFWSHLAVLGPRKSFKFSFRVNVHIKSDLRKVFKQKLGKKFCPEKCFKITKLKKNGRELNKNVVFNNLRHNLTEQINEQQRRVFKKNCCTKMLKKKLKIETRKKDF